MVLLVNIYLFIIIYRCILIHSPICMSILLFSPKLPDMDQWPTSILRTNDGMAIFIGWEDEDILITWNSSQAARAWLNHATSSRQTSCRGFRHVERKNDICKQKTRKLKPGSQKKKPLMWNSKTYDFGCEIGTLRLLQRQKKQRVQVFQGRF